MWPSIVSFVMSLIQSKKRGLYGSIFIIFILVLSAFGWGYVKPAIAASETKTQAQIDSLKTEKKLTDQKLDFIIDNLKDLKDDNKEIKNDIKYLLRKR